MTPRSLALALAAVAALAGCTESRGGLGLQCERNTECQSPLVCRLTRCRQECRSLRDCPIGSLCLRDQDGVGACRLPDEAICARASDCPDPLQCIGGACTEECASDRDCPPGAWCEGEEGARGCVNPTGASCTVSADCPEGTICGFDGRCRPPCRTSRDCPFGLACEGGLCVGLDAGTEDAGLPPDAGLDGGPSDAGIDAGGECSAAADCTAPNVATSDCVGGACVIDACATGFDDCNGDFDDGCELDVSADPENCGVCGGQCGLGGVCADGSCDTVVDVALGFSHLCVVRSSGVVLCLGSNFQGQLGRGITSTRETTFDAAMITDATGADLGAALSCFERPGGTAACTGSDEFGEVGDGGGTSFSVTAPREVDGLTDVVELSAGGDYARNASGFPLGVLQRGFACARRTGGAVSCWGSALLRGDGGTADATAPVTVPALTALDVSAGMQSVCAVRDDRQVVCWGVGGPWLGPDGLADTGTPILVPGITDATHVAVGETHACARLDTGAVACWGEGPSGQLGATVAGDTSASPVTVTGLVDAVDVDVSEFVSCALRAGGRVSCWGWNGGGDLGGGTVGGQSVSPVEAAGLTDAVRLTVGRGQACVLRANGAVACWGGRASDYGLTDTTDWSSPTDHPLFPPTPTP